MDYKAVITKDAEDDLDRFVKYLIFEKKNMQAAQNVLDDYDATIESLKHVAGSLKLCDNPRLCLLEYRRINFLNHRYFMLYRIVDHVVFVDNIFHELQDYENRMYQRRNNFNETSAEMLRSFGLYSICATGKSPVVFHHRKRYNTFDNKRNTDRKDRGVSCINFAAVCVTAKQTAKEI